MDEKEFKKLASNQRDWELYRLLSERSKEVFKEEYKKCANCRKYETEECPPWPTKGPNDWCTQYEVIKKEVRIHSPGFEDYKPPEPEGETTVQENIQGIVRIVTDKAVQIVVGIRSAWIPKSAVKNLSSIVLVQGKPVSLDIHAWFTPKIEWKVI